MSGKADSADENPQVPVMALKSFIYGTYRKYLKLLQNQPKTAPVSFGLGVPGDEVEFQSFIS